jgi:hypothetical protein
MSGEEPAPGPALRTAPPTSYPADHLVALGLVLALAESLGVGIASRMARSWGRSRLPSMTRSTPIPSRVLGRRSCGKRVPFSSLLPSPLCSSLLSPSCSRRAPSWLGGRAGAIALCGGVPVPRGAHSLRQGRDALGLSQSMANQMARAHQTALRPLGDWRIQLVPGACLVLVGAGFSLVAH